MRALDTEILLYYGGAAISVFYFVIFIITASMFARQKGSTEKPDQYLSDRIILYPCGYTKKLKVMTLITISGFFVLLPAAIAYGIGRVYLDDRAWIPGAIALGIGFIVWLIIAMQPSSIRMSRKKTRSSTSPIT